MEVNMEIKFKDGTRIMLTESQYLELKSMTLGSRSKYTLDYFKKFIPNYLSEKGKVTEAKLYNVHRNCDRVLLNEAIESLHKDGVINVTHESIKHVGTDVITLSIA